MYHDLVPSFAICNTNKDDGVTKDELHALACQEFIRLGGADVDYADQIFDEFDVDENGAVSVQEFFNTAVMLVNAKEEA